MVQQNLATKEESNSSNDSQQSSFNDISQYRTPLPIDCARILDMPLGVRLFQTDLTAALYVKIGFRFIGSPANIKTAQLETESQLVRNLSKLNPNSATPSLIQTGYDEHFKLEDATTCLAKLHDPRHRIINELFWPHVNEKIFETIKRERNISSSKALQSFSQNSAPTNGKLSDLFAAHALAISHHNLALSKEFEFVQGRIDWTNEDWLKALSYWKIVQKSDAFWDYLANRAKNFDDPRLRSEDVHLLRQKLPSILLAFNALFARMYAKFNGVIASAGHISVIQKSQMQRHDIQETLTSLVQTLAKQKLEPLINHVESELLSPKNRYKRSKFEKVCTEVLEKAFGTRDTLLKDLQISQDMVETTEFDRFCDVIIKGCDNKIDFDTDKRLCDILYTMIVAKKMLDLPLSSIMRRKLEQQLYSDTNILYGDFISNPDEVDPTVCWFLENEPADPDSSILVPVYKITNREVQVDSYRDTAGIVVSYDKPIILVPCSTLAKNIHDGKISVKELAKMREDEETNEIKAEIRNIEVSRDKSIQDIEQNVEKMKTQFKAKLNDKLRTYNNKVADEEEQHKTLIQKKQTELEGNIQYVEDTCAQDCVKAKDEDADAIAAANETYQEAANQYKGLRGGHRLELPVVGISTLLAVAGSLFATANDLFPLAAGLVWQLGLSVVLGIMVSVLTGQFVRMRKTKVARKPLLTLQKQLDLKIAKIKKTSQEMTKRLEQTMSVATRNARKCLETYEAYRQELHQENEKLIEDIKAKADIEIMSINKSNGVQIAKLEKKLEACLKPKPKSDKKKFPPYKKAKSQGFKNGRKPSSSEMEMTYSEEQEARRKLGIYY